MPDRISIEKPLASFDIAAERRPFRDALIKAGYDTWGKLDAALKSKGHKRLTIYFSLSKFLSGKSYRPQLFLSGKPTVLADMQTLAGMAFPKRPMKGVTPLASFDIAPERRPTRNALIEVGHDTKEKLEAALKEKGHKFTSIHFCLDKFLSRKSYTPRLFQNGKPTVFADIQTLAGVKIPEALVVTEEIVKPKKPAEQLRGNRKLAVPNASQTEPEPKQPAPSPEKALEQPRPLETLLKGMPTPTASERFEAALKKAGDALQNQARELAVTPTDTDRLIENTRKLARLGYEKGCFKPPATMDYNEAVGRFAGEILRRVHRREAVAQIGPSPFKAAKEAQPG